MLARKAVWVLSVLVLSSSPGLRAVPLTFELDPKATTVELTFGATLHTVNGSLRAKQGTVRINSDTGQASGWIVLDAASAQTGNARRDRKMHEKILESRRFPDIVFDVQRVTGKINLTGRSELQLQGILDFHGDRHTLSLPVVATSDGSRVTATGSLDIPYVDWGLRDPSFFLLRVDKEVRVTVRAVGRLTG